MKKLNVFLIATVASGFLMTSIAQDKSGYWTDTYGNLVKSGSGECVRTARWTPELAMPVCEGTVALAMTTALSSDGLFAFGQSKLQSKVVADLDALVGKLKDKKVAKIAVTGHTDRLGSAAINTMLGKKRADTVKGYLVSKGVDKSLIQTDGVGSSQPKTTASQCVGEVANAKLVACLAPDRRVDLKVTFR